jgi:hypothetical protein
VYEESIYFFCSLPKKTAKETRLLLSVIQYQYLFCFHAELMPLSLAGMGGGG